MKITAMAVVFLLILGLAITIHAKGIELHPAHWFLMGELAIGVPLIISHI